MQILQRKNPWPLGLKKLGGGMDRKVTRKEFLKMAAIGVAAVFILPALKKMNLFRKTQYKEARYYKKLAG